MPHPISIPAAPLLITDAQHQKAEELLAALLRVIAYGTTGTPDSTPPMLTPDLSGEFKPMLLEKAEQQLLWRQFMVALSATLSTGEGSVADRLEVDCRAEDNVGDVVCVSGDKIVQRSNPSMFHTMPPLGIVTSKLSETRCVVQTRGLVEGLYDGLEPNRIYFVGDDGRPSPTPPQPEEGEIRWWCKLGLAIGSRTFDLRPSLEMIERRG